MDSNISSSNMSLLELYALADIPDLSIYAIGIPEEGSGSDGPEFILSGSLSAGDYLYLGRDESEFHNFFGFVPDILLPNLAELDFNGDEGVELYDISGEAPVVIDTFGEATVNGEGAPWNWQNSWAYRSNLTGPDGNTFILDNWRIPGPDVLSFVDNNATAPVPFPLGSYHSELQDTIPPNAMCTNALYQIPFDGSNNLTPNLVDGGSTDDSGIALRLLFDSNGRLLNNLNCGDLGENTVTLKVYDSDGNTSSCAAVVSVEPELVSNAICNDITLQIHSQTETTAINIDQVGSFSEGVCNGEGSELFFLPRELKVFEGSLDETSLMDDLQLGVLFSYPYQQNTITVPESQDYVLNLSGSLSLEIESPLTFVIYDQEPVPNSGNLFSRPGLIGVFPFDIDGTPRESPIVNLKSGVTYYVQIFIFAAFTDAEFSGSLRPVDYTGPEMVSTLEFDSSDVGESIETVVFIDEDANRSMCQTIVTVEEASTPFITTWKTDNPGISNDDQITIPTISAWIYDYDVDWGDGSTSENLTGNATHTYSTPGTYTVSISGQFPQIFFNQSGEEEKLIAINQWGSITWSSLFASFSGCLNMDVLANDTPDLSANPDLAGMFNNCSAMVGNASFETWDTTGITNMQGLFGGCERFDQAIGGWDVSSVENMIALFSRAKSFNQDLSMWKVGSVTNMLAMFADAESFNQDIGSWDVSQVTDMTLMFAETDAFDQDLGNWDVGMVNTMEGMFNDSGLSNANYDNTLIGWNQLPTLQNDVAVGAPLNFYCLSESARQNLIDTYNWTFNDGGKSTDCQRPFITTWHTDPNSFGNRQIIIPTHPDETYNYTVFWGDGTADTNVVGDITHTYSTPGTYTVTINGQFPRINFLSNSFNRPRITTIEQWGDIEWTSMERAFYGCNNLKVVATDTPDLSAVSSLKEMFRFCGSLVGNENFGNWDVSTIENMSGLFGFSSFDQDLSKWNVSLVINMSGMFSGSSGLSVENYDKTLIGWSQLPSLQNEVRLDVENFYCLSVNARQSIIDTYGWAINDVGFGCIADGPKITSSDTIGFLENAIGVVLDVESTDNSDSEGAGLIYSLTGSVDDNLFNIDVTSGEISFIVSPDFDTPLDVGGNNVYNLIVKVTDSEGFADRQEVAVTVIKDDGSNQDSDFDGVIDALDECPNTPPGQVVDEKGCEFNNIIYEYLEENFSKWFGGDDRPEFGPRNLGTGQSIFFDKDVRIESFSTKFQRRFDFSDNPDRTGHAVELVLQVRDANGQIITSTNNMLSADFDGGWVRFVFDSILELPGDALYYFTWYLKDGLTNDYFNGSIGDRTSSFELGNGLGIRIEEGGDDSDFDDFQNWNNSGADFVFKITGTKVQNAPFITTWKTDNPGVSEDNQIVIPTFPGETYDYTVNWGDGTIESGFTGDASHTYATPGVYEVSIMGKFPQILFSEAGDNNKIIDIVQWGDIVWQSFNSSFAGCQNLDISATDLPDLSQVSSFKQTFFSCQNLKGNPSMNNWDTSRIVDMSSMFAQAMVFNQNIGNWDVSQVTDMSQMFAFARAFNQPIGSWNVAEVRTMDTMFGAAVSFNQDIGTWNVSKVKSMQNMFTSASSFDNPIENWNVSTVTNMAGMFNGANTFNQELGNWDVGNVTNMDSMFEEAFLFNADLSNWDVSKVQNTFDMFESCALFDQDLGSWDISSLVNARFMFSGAGLSKRNYDNTLIGWRRLDPEETKIPTNVDARNLTLSSFCLADEARQELIDDFGWTITDGGQDCPPLAVLSFNLIDADTDTVIQTLTDGALIDIASLPSMNLSIEALATDDVESVRLSLNGPVSNERTESVAPYALFGDGGGDFMGMMFEKGTYSINAVPYSGDGLSGTRGTSLSVGFELTIGAPDFDFSFLEVTQPTTCGGAEGQIEGLLTGPLGLYEINLVGPVSFSEPLTIELTSNERSFSLLALTAGAYTFSVTQLATDTTKRMDFGMNDPELPMVGLQPLTNVQESDAAFALTGGSPMGGTYSGNGVSNGMFDPQAVGPGVYEITYTYTDPLTNCTASATTELSVLSDAPSVLSVLSFRLINADTDMIIGTLTDGEQIVVNSLPTMNLSIEAVTTADVESVRMTLNGPISNARTESVAPYALFGDMAGDFMGMGFAVGDYTINAVPYSGNGLGGTMGTPLSIDFSLIEDNSGNFTIRFREVKDPTTCGGADGEIFLDIISIVPDFDYTVNVSGPVVLNAGPGRLAGFGFVEFPSGDYVFTVTQVGTGIQKSLEVTLNDPAAPEVSFDPLANVQENDSPFILTGGSPAGGTYSGTGVNGGQFDPQTAGVGSYLITYTYVDPVTNCSSSASQSITVLPDAPASLSVISFNLIDADNDVVLASLSEGQQIDFSTLPTLNLNIEAVTTDDVESVRLELSGALSNQRTENVAPFALFGDRGGDFNGVPFVAGSYSISATPYSEKGLSGMTGTALTVTFELVEPLGTNRLNSLKLWPNPVVESVNLSFEYPAELIEVQVYDMQGRLVRKLKVDQRKTDHTVSVGDLPAGMYFIKTMDVGGQLFEDQLMIER
ncbi:MAG: BspA family leucine-rich repeat surface protein [Flavobacteriaceae bacterium]|nr:BspA family leucine-rich repeat surface protein [Flavobacteriaceae bacterium]